MEKLKIIVLAAGTGTRMNSDLPKVLIPVGGKPILKWILKSIQKSGLTSRPVIVVGHKSDEVMKEICDSVDYVVQDVRMGTGHAVMVAEPLVLDKAENVLVLNGDQPFVSPETLNKIFSEHVKNNSDMTIATTLVPDTETMQKHFYSWGRVVRDAKGAILKIIEVKDAIDEEKNIMEVNPSYFCFKANVLWPMLKKLENNNAQKEYYLTDLVEMIFKENSNISTVDVDFME